jgi:hypothetical protein
VEHGGVYYGLPGVEPWGLPERDAREYGGPWPVVAHPPCERWGRYATGGPGFRGAVRPRFGDDDGCFVAALRAVWTFGGVLEHPAGSGAWRHFGLTAPPRGGGWVPSGAVIGGLLHLSGWTCCVDQGRYGHRAQKATWLFAAHVGSLCRRLRGDRRNRGCGPTATCGARRRLAAASGSAGNSAG